MILFLEYYSNSKLRQGLMREKELRVSEHTGRGKGNFGIRIVLSLQNHLFNRNVKGMDIVRLKKRLLLKPIYSQTLIE